jgi:hypothetical protein
VGREHLEELQQLLLKDDQYIVGKRYADPENLAASAHISATSAKPLENRKQDRLQSLTEAYALSLPLNGRVGEVCFYGKAARDTTLCASIYRADKPENYQPAEQVASMKVAVSASDDVNEIRLPVDMHLPAGHYFVELEANAELALAMSEYSFTGAITARKKLNNNPTHVDYRTGQMKPYEWAATQGCLCFRVDGQDGAFGAENLCNGYSRPFVGSNIWHSNDKNDQNLTLRWDAPQNISQIKLIFDSNLNRFCRSAETDYTDLFYRMVKDYDVYYKDQGGQLRLLCAVRDNFQRVNELDFETVCTNELVISLRETHGQDFFSVYEIRCYH